MKIKSVEKKIETYFYCKTNETGNYGNMYRRDVDGNWEKEYVRNYSCWVPYSPGTDLEKLFQEHLRNNP